MIYPGNIGINEAVENFREGKVMVSFGLLTEMVVDNKFGPGELVPSSSKELTISLRSLAGMDYGGSYSFICKWG